MSYIMGIDIGTYQSKGVLVRRDGLIMASTSLDHQLEIPRQGWAEHDAEKTWWQDFKKITGDLLACGARDYGIKANEIAGVAISAIAPAVVPVDREGRPLRKAILYGVDTRAGKEIEYLNSLLGEEKIFKTAGHRLSSQSAGPKILWIKNNEPSVYEKTDKFLAGNGYLIYKLTGEYILDYYTAAAYSPLFDLDNLSWQREFTGRVTELEKLPELTWSHEVAGRVSQQAASETGLAPGTKVITGTADALAESISIGAVEEGDLMLMYGSSTFFIQVMGARPVSKNLWPSVHGVPGKNTLTGGTATAGSITRWFLDNWLEGRKEDLDQAYTRLTEKAVQSRPGAEGLITLPYFSGERTPLHNPEARGVFFGLTLKHTVGDLYRSILEGVGFSIRHNIEEMNKVGVSPARVIAVGGGTKNRLWLEIVSSICRLEQLVPEETIGASYGDAFLAALGLGWYDSLEDVKKWVSYSLQIEPDLDLSRIYDSHYELYRRLYKNTESEMKQISLLEGGNNIE